MGTDKLSPSEAERSDKFCAKFCFMLWFAIPASLQIACMYMQELENYYVVGRTGDYAFIDIQAMANFLVFFCVYGTACVFNATIETIVPHAHATKKLKMAGHMLNRSIFLWCIIGGCLAGGILQIDLITTNLLDWDEDDAAACKEYMIWLLPSLFFWGVADIHRRFFNSFEYFYLPLIAYGTTTLMHPFLAKFMLVN